MPLPTIPSGNVASALPTGYEIANSVRMNDDDTPYFNKTPTAGDRAKWTFSCWFKLGGAFTSTHALLVSGGNSADQSTIRLDSGVIDWVEWDQSGSAVAGRLITNKIFRDTTAWYHLVCTWDSDNGTAGNRMRMYINGVEETSFSTDTNPTSGYDSAMNSNVLHEIGRQSWNSSGYFDGYLAEMAFCDGQAYAASDFGEFDDDSPTIWKPKDISTLTFGTRGWYLDFEDSDDLDDDESGNGNDWTANNLAAIDQCTDTPTNNFCVLNPNNGGGSYTDNDTYSEGNTIMVASDYSTTMGTFGVTNGKWYWEAHIVWNGTSNNANFPRTIGIMTDDYSIDGYSYLGQEGNSWGMNFVDTTTDIWKMEHDSSSTSITSATTMANGDVMMFALDMDNGALYFGRGGTWYTSGDPTSGASKTGAVITLSTADMAKHILPALTSATSGTYYKMNFGNPAFTISSGNSDGAGYGNFEYAPPSGYYALCTKNLAEYG